MTRPAKQVSTRPTEQVTEEQAEVLDMIRILRGWRRVAPTPEELGEALGCTEAIVQRSLQQLRALGLVDWEPGRVRTLHVVGDVVRPGH